MNAKLSARKQKVEQFLKKYHRELSALSLIGGFVIDAFTLQRIDLLFENLVLYTHLTIVGASIILIHLVEEGRLGGWFARRVRPWLPFVSQFSFGALFSGFLIFYSRSATFISGWPFLLIIFVVLIGNELIGSYRTRLGFQLSVFFLAVFSLAIFSVPIVIKHIGADVFLLSGVVSLVVFGLFVWLLQTLGPKRFIKDRSFVVKSTLGIFLVLNVLYFTNILPPIPLSLKEAGVYHSIARTDGDMYQFEEEARPWYQFFGRDIMHVIEGEPVYFYSSIFAPTDLNTKVVHHWQRYNTDENEWETNSRIGFPIVGGRDGGYRGYSQKTQLTPGMWRVDVETQRGQIIGRVDFTIENVTTPPEYEVIVR